MTKDLSFFISYAREDRDVVLRLDAALKGLNAITWIDVDDILPTAKVWASITEAIDRSSAFVFVLSPNSLRAVDTCLAELQHAVGGGKRIIAIRVADVSDLDIPEPLRDSNWIALEDVGELDKCVERLTWAATVDMDWVVTHGRLLQRAVEWDRDGRPATGGLRARELREIEPGLLRADGAREPHLVEIQRDLIAASRAFAVRRRRLLVGGGLVLIVALTGLLTLALISQRTATTQRDTARSRQLAAASEAQVGNDQQLAVLLALEAMRIRPTDAADAALRRAMVDFSSSDRVDVDTLLQHLSSTGQSGSVNGIISAEFDRDGTHIATSSEDGSVRVWTTANLRRAPVVVGVDGRSTINALSFSRDGTHLATGSTSGVVTIFNWRARKKVASWHPHGGAIRDVAFSPTDKAAVIVASAGGTVGEWTWDGRERHRVLRGHRGAATSVDYYPTGEILVSGGVDGTIRVRSSAGRHLALLRLPGTKINDVRFLGSDEIVSAQDDGTIRIWNWTERPQGRQEAKLLTRTRHPASVVMSVPDRGEILVAAADGRYVSLWHQDLGPRETVGTHREVDPATVPVADRGSGTTAVRFSPGGRRLLSVGSDGVLRLWRVGRRRETARVIRFGVSSYGVAVSPDRRLVASAGIDGAVRLWPAAGRSEEPTLLLRGGASQRDRGFADDAMAVTFSPDGRYLASTGRDGKLLVWAAKLSTTPLRPLRTIKVSSGEVLGAAFGPDGRHIATVGDGMMRVTDWRDGRPGKLERVARGTSMATSVAFSPRGDVVVSADGEGAVHVWKWRQQSRARLLKNRAHQLLNSVAISPDGQEVATASLGGLMQVWNIVDGSSRGIEATPGAKWGTSFSADGNYVLTVSEDGTLIIWPWRLGASPILAGDFSRPLVPEPLVDAAGFSPDLRRMASGVDGTLLVRNCLLCGPVSEVVDAARQLVTRDLTEAERDQFNVPR